MKHRQRTSNIPWSVSDFKYATKAVIHRDLTDKPNRNRNRIESESGKEFNGDINISVVVIRNFVMEVIGLRFHIVREPNSRILIKTQPLHWKDIQLIFMYRMSEYRLI